MKKTFPYILIFLCFSLLSSCSANLSYKDNIPCDKLAKELSEIAPVDNGYLEYGEEQIQFFFDDTKLHNDFSILYSEKADNINEIGVFHCPTEAAARELYEIVDDYLDEMEETQTNFIMSYAPMEIVKLDDADVRRYGNYVIYAILDTKHQKELWNVVQNTLTQ